MRAVIAEQAGPPEVLHEIETVDPIPADGEVVIAVDIAATTFVETQMRAGRSPGPPMTFPAVLGNGVGGTVCAVGSDVETAWIGVTVVTTTGGRGGYATLAVAAARDLHRLPEGVDLETAVALLADGRTALGLATAARIKPGDMVAVTAAAGGVGTLLVQLAVAGDARVIALVGSDAKRDLPVQLGAEAALNYSEPRWLRRLNAAAPTGFNVAFDGVGGEVSAALTSRLNRGGRYLPHGAAGGPFGKVDEAFAEERRVTTISLSQIAGGPAQQFQLVEEALRLAARGKLRPIIGQTFPLSRAADAHAAMEARQTTGKTLLRV